MTSASPSLTTVTLPLPLTVAIAAFDDDHVARAVTSWALRFANLAIAINCAVWPMPGARPLTETDDTVADALVSLLLHAVNRTSIPMATAVVDVLATDMRR
jgi:hypothetical protein